ncbi:MAG TPA: EAL domain-containing protein [Acidimicrobiales bacterium]|nr:EAL domain-containing protein [Acidimicrobiales bacterium]
MLTALGVVGAAALASSSSPDLVALALFGSLLVWAENAAVLLPTKARVSPSFMVVMASIAAFRHEGAVLGAALVGCCGGFAFGLIRRKRYRVVVYNCGQYAIAAAGAAYASNVLASHGVSDLIAYTVAGVVFAALNVVLIVPATAADTGAPLRAVWADMAPTLPNYLAFGLLGILIGQLYDQLGVVVVIVLVTPLVVARSVFGAFQGLRQAYRRLEVLYGFTEHVGGALDVDAVVQTTLAQVRQSLRVEQVELALLEDDGTLIRCTIGRSGSGTPVVTRVDEPADDDAHRLEMRVLGEGRPFSTSIEGADDALAAALAARGMRHVMAAPLQVEGRTVGVLIVADREDDGAPFGSEEIQLLATLSNHVSVAFQNGRLIEQLREESLHDSLTGLANRTMFQAAVNDAAPSCTGTRAGAVMLMDLDRFKEVNDTLGHESGDRLLVQISRRLTELLDDDAVIARLGGDEFAILLPQVDGPIGAAAVAETLLVALERPFVVGDLNLEIGASIGVALAPVHGTDAATLLQRADVAMYSAKESRTGFEVYDPDRDEYSPRRLMLAAELRHAIERGQLTVHYQPKADLKSGHITGVEALLRWHHPDYGFIPPDEFIPLAEHTGLIRALTRWVLAASVTQCGAWQRRGLHLNVAVNLSVRSLLDVGLADEVESVLRQAGVSPTSLTLEITESSIMADPVRSISVLNRLADLGITLSIDDFGTGYSSLSYLKKLPVAEVKVDRSFVMNMSADQDDAVIVRSTIDLARNLGLRVVAEGVEDRPTWDQLTSLGCDAAQGYYLGRPMPIVQLDRWLADQEGPSLRSVLVQSSG